MKLKFKKGQTGLLSKIVIITVLLIGAGIAGLFSKIPTSVWIIAIMIFILWITKKKK